MTDEDTSAAPVRIMAGDAAAQCLTGAPPILNLSARSSDPALIPPENIAIRNLGEHWTIVATPARAQSGTAEITVSVKNEAGAMSSASFHLSVRPVNGPPTIIPTTKGPTFSVSRGFSSARIQADGSFAADYASVIGKGQVIEISEDLVTWREFLMIPKVPDSGKAVVSDRTQAGTQRFFRARLVE